MNEINYLKHKLYTPKTYHRRFDADLPSKEGESTWKNQAKRVALAALPYIALYRPAGLALSIGMGSYRAVSHIGNAVASLSEKNWKNASFQLFFTVLAILSVASTIFHFTAGLALTTAIETLQGGITAGQALFHGEYRKAAEETLQTVATATYLSFMMFGSLELMVAFSLLQATTCFAIQARGDIEQGRYLEAASKIGMGLIRCCQTRGYVQQIKQRDRFFAMQKYAALIQRALRAREVRHLLDSPLTDIQGNIEKHDVRLGDAKLGAYFHGFGKSLVKGANLAFRTTIIDGQEISELDFKVNHLFRDKIQWTIDDFSRLKSKEVQELLQLTQSHATGIRIQHPPMPLGNGSIGKATKITLDGLGSILIGNSTDVPNMYDRVVVQMDAKKTIYDFHELMAFLDIDQALHTSSQQDLDRLKMGHLFRTFSPREATPFERSEAFFDLPLDQLKQKMIEQAPKMQEIFDNYYTQMTPEEILPGKIRYRMNGLAKEAYNHGARGLSAAITGTLSNAALFERVASLLKVGMLSSETRMQGGMNVNGISNGNDFAYGGADSIFTQMFTERNCRKHEQFSQLSNYQSSVRVLISLDALEMGAYQYLTASAGIRKLPLPNMTLPWQQNYPIRPGVLEFVDTLQNLQTGSMFHWHTNMYEYSQIKGHELMFKERIAPSFFTGLAVPNEDVRRGLLNYLRGQNLVQLDGAGRETILGKPVSQFIKITTSASEELFD